MIDVEKVNKKAGLAKREGPRGALTVDISVSPQRARAPNSLDSVPETSLQPTARHLFLLASSIRFSFLLAFSWPKTQNPCLFVASARCYPRPVFRDLTYEVDRKYGENGAFDVHLQVLYLLIYLCI